MQNYYQTDLLQRIQIYTILSDKHVVWNWNANISTIIAEIWLLTIYIHDIWLNMPLNVILAMFLPLILNKLDPVCGFVLIVCCFILDGIDTFYFLLHNEKILCHSNEKIITLHS